MSRANSRPPGLRDRRLWTLAVAALGVVFGDIGTSPLYAFHVCFSPRDGGLPITTDNILGVLSLIFWALIIIVSIKYVAFIMRADLNGEGGILALTGLAASTAGRSARVRKTLVALGMFGAALLYGDGMLTPAISVLSAVEGLRVATPVFEDAVPLIAVIVLLALFTFQRRGTAAVGAVFGPVMVVWFVVLAVLGVHWISAAPVVLEALSPHHAVRLLVTGGIAGYLILGSVFLAVTGGEALYADIGHFGTRPIRMMWFAIVLPAVSINYFGQGAMLLTDPTAIQHTFYRMAPPWALYPMVVLATAAAVIASQAIIAGAFSLTAQALHLGFCPSITVRHSSEEEEGQIYVPAVNWLLLGAAVALVLAFRSSGSLAGAYGVAVSGTMVLTNLLAFWYFGHRWGWLAVVPIGAVLLPVDLAFLGANLTKVDRGGWVPLLVAAVGFLIFTTWTRGQAMVTAAMGRRLGGDSLKRIADRRTTRVPGTAVYLTRAPGMVPRALLHNLTHNHVLHRETILLTVTTQPVPRVRPEDHVAVEQLGSHMYAVLVRYGYMERPNVPEALAEAANLGAPVDPKTTTYFLSRSHVVVTNRGGMAHWRKRLFEVLVNISQPKWAGYRIPTAQVFEVGIHVEL